MYAPTAPPLPPLLMLPSPLPLPQFPPPIPPDFPPSPPQCPLIPPPHCQRTPWPRVNPPPLPPRPPCPPPPQPHPLQCPAVPGPPLRNAQHREGGGGAGPGHGRVPHKTPPQTPADGASHAARGGGGGLGEWASTASPAGLCRPPQPPGGGGAWGARPPLVDGPGALHNAHNTQTRGPRVQTPHFLIPKAWHTAWGRWAQADGRGGGGMGQRRSGPREHKSGANPVHGPS